jgi:hypothetical protein
MLTQSVQVVELDQAKRRAVPQPVASGVGLEKGLRLLARCKGERYRLEDSTLTASIVAQQDSPGDGPTRGCVLEIDGQVLEAANIQ